MGKKKQEPRTRALWWVHAVTLKDLHHVKPFDLTGFWIIMIFICCIVCQ